ncbi:hypothetical protein [Endozoicomonas sp. YOMI1]|uniref:hypothetical protein n=1 Tax=Endozoicomonas sp. YOMI1 TaxID=2828739 RepID=UPI002148443F|nr:hypothetical protein [Endozoicomonas sp. YOMI1]
MSHKPKAYQQAEQTTKIPASRSELRIDRVWGMASEASSHSYSVNANPPPLTSTLENTAGSSLSGVKVSASGSGESLNFSHGKPYQKAYAQPEIRSVSKQATQSGKGRACAQSEKRKAYQSAYAKTEKRKAYQRAYAKTEKRKAYQKVYQRAYAKTEKRKAYQKVYQKAYAKTEKRKAYLKACAQSRRERAAKRAYVQSEKGKTSKQAWEQSQERKALQKAAHEIFKHTSDKEQEKITGKQAAVFIRELNNAKSNEL